MGKEKSQRYAQGFRSVNLEEQRHIPLDDPKFSSDSEIIWFEEAFSFFTVESSTHLETSS